MDSLAIQNDQKLIAAQQLRLRRSLMAVGAGFANSLVILVAWQFGYVLFSMESLAIYFAISSLGFTSSFFVTFRLVAVAPSPLQKFHRLVPPLSPRLR